MIISQSHRVDALNGAQRKKYRAVLGPSPEHARAADVRDFDPDAWRDYFKFCFVRDPWERAVSDWQWRTRKRGIQVSFMEYLERLARAQPGDRLIPHQVDNWPIYTIDNRIAVDRVGRFERLTEDFREICTRIGLNEVPELPHAKAGTSGEGYQRWYGPREKELVEKLFAREIGYFQYRFE